jgi:hypothetical protein
LTEAGILLISTEKQVGYGNEYMQELPGSVKLMVGSVYSMPTKKGNLKLGSGDLLPKATKQIREAAASD